MNIHQRIKERRLALGLDSHGALAELVGVSWQTVQQWEKENGTAPKRARMEKVAQVLGVSVGWLQNGDTDVAPAPKKVSIPDSLADALKLTTETAMELRLLSIYRLSSKDGRLLIDQAVDSAGKDVNFGGHLNEGQ